MNNRLFRYSEFLSESSIGLLLEAKIAYGREFSETLAKIDSKIADALKGIVGTEVDVNTNYIDIDKSKDDMVRFRPDDKVGKSAIARQPGAHYDVMSEKILGDKYRSPRSGQAGIIEREISWEEAGEGWGFVYPHSTLVVFMWRDESGEGRCVFDKRSLTIGPEAVKPTQIGVGRLVRGLLSKAGIEFADADIEDFVYKYRAEMAKKKDAMNRFRIVSGAELRKLYHYDSYETQTGTLGNSCMRYSRCQDYLGIYVENPDVCSMVVLDSEGEDGKICGRALLWTSGGGRQVMDRIYTNRREDEELFKEFAKKNGFWHKANQNMEENPFISPEGKEENMMVMIPIKGSFAYYPYLDTFKYYRDAGDSSYLTNDHDKRHDYTLTDTDGGNGDECEMCGGGGRTECPECYGNGDHRCEDCDGDGELECGACGNVRERDCDSCDGSGEDAEGNECGECEGSGVHVCEECHGKPTECGACDGEGRIECEFCGGNGEVDCPECG